MLWMIIVLFVLILDPEKAAQEHERRGSGQSHYNPRQTLFFTAITSFAIKNSLGEVERYYASKVGSIFSSHYFLCHFLFLNTLQAVSMH